MALLKKVPATTLAESIIAMTLAIFLFGFIAWFFASIDQNRSGQKDKMIYQSLLLDFDNDQNTIYDPTSRFTIEEEKDYYDGDKRLIVNNVKIISKEGQVVYSYKLWQVNNEILSIE